MLSEDEAVGSRQLAVGSEDFECFFLVLREVEEHRTYRTDRTNGSDRDGDCMTITLVYNIMFGFRAFDKSLVFQ